MAYAFITYLQARSALAQRLSDASKNFFIDAELGVYVKEALQTFNALANFYRDDFTFPARQNVTWYDLTDSTNLPNTLRPLTTTDQSLLNAIEYHLLEPQTASYPLTWTGSKQFAVTDILNALQQVRDQTLSESGCTITQRLVAAVSGRTTLADTVINIRRVAWIPNTGLGYAANCLMPSDIWGTQSFEPGFVQAAPGIPQIYRRSTEPPLSFDVDIQPAVAGNYDVLTVDAGATLLTTASTILPVPNDWCWAIKFGALAQLFGRDGLAADPLRANYCSERFVQAMAAMRLAPALLAARIANVPVVVDAVQAADFYRANWQALAAGVPDSLYYAGLNMVALVTLPNAGSYTVTATVVRNMPLPVADGDFLQVGRDDINAILDYAQHVAMLKCGGAEFASTFPLYSSFIRHCTLYNSKLSAMSPFREWIDLRSQEDDRLNPTFSSVTPATATGAGQ
jgi:hypothetical protein